MACLLLGIHAQARADENPADGAHYTVFAEDGAALFRYAGQVYVDDEYIAANNKAYRVVSVSEMTRTAYAAFIEDTLMPEVGELAVLAENRNRAIAMYCTHSDESYIEGDGKQSHESGKGGIYDIADELKQHLEQKGIAVTLDTTNHLPHDAGAYRRSRQTAVRLMQKNMPAALIDIHRDGIPDPDEYTAEVDGQTMTMVRIEVGRSNPNRTANREFAVRLKAVADKAYPGLVKDIFIGKGNYNQELMPRAILLEFGTHTSDKQQVLASTRCMADVVATALFGTSSNAAGNAEGTPQPSGQSPGGDAGFTRQSAQQPLESSNKGAGSGILWVLGIALGGGLIVLLLSTGGGRAFVDNLRGKASEMTGGMLGNRRKKDGGS